MGFLDNLRNALLGPKTAKKASGGGGRAARAGQG